MNFIQLLRNSYNNIIITVILVVIVTFNQFLSVGPVLERGLHTDDWNELAFYKIETRNLSFFDGLTENRNIHSRYYSNEYNYLGILNHIFGINYKAFYLTSIILKILATISIYPLILVLFQKKTLAILSTFFYSVSPSAAGSLKWVCTGIDYLSIIFLSFFGISYYYLIRKKGRIFKILITATLLLLAVLCSPRRIYPFFIIIAVIEIIILLKALRRYGFKERVFKTLLRAAIRLATFYIVIKFLFIDVTNGGDFPDTSYPSKIFSDVVYFGNWHKIFTPIASFGFTISDSDALKMIFGNFSYSDTSSITPFLWRLTLFYFFLSIFSAWLISPKNLKPSFLIIFLMNSIAGLYILMAAKNSETAPFINNNPHFASFNLYPTIIGVFFSLLGFFILLKGLLFRIKEKLLLPIIISPFFILTFTVVAWVATGGMVYDNMQIHHYLTIPAIGYCVLISAIFIMTFKRLLLLKKKCLKKILMILFLSIFLSLYFYNVNYIKTFFTEENVINGKSGVLQTQLRSKFLHATDSIKPNESFLVYIEIPNNLNLSPNYTANFFESIKFISLFDKNYNIGLGCKKIYFNFKDLEEIAYMKNNKIRFEDDVFCISKSGINHKLTQFTLDKFYAFYFVDFNFFDIKVDVIDKLKNKLSQTK